MSEQNLINIKEQKLTKLKEAIKSYPNFPKEGIIFRDFFPLLRSPQLLGDMLTSFEDIIKDKASDVHLIAGLESRGFLIGPPLALKLNVPFIPIRKPGKLPGLVKKELYTLEYGNDGIEIQIDCINENQKNVVIVDDLLATGGTMNAAIKLVQSIGGIVPCCIVVMELRELKGRNNIPVPIYSLMEF